MIRSEFKEQKEFIGEKFAQLDLGSETTGIQGLIYEMENKRTWILETKKYSTQDLDRIGQDITNNLDYFQAQREIEELVITFNNNCNASR